MRGHGRGSHVTVKPGLAFGSHITGNNVGFATLEVRLHPSDPPPRRVNIFIYCQTVRPLSSHGLEKQFRSEISQIGLFVRERKGPVPLAGSGTRLRRDLHPLPAQIEPGVLPVDRRGKRWC